MDYRGIEHCFAARLRGPVRNDCGGAYDKKPRLPFCGEMRDDRECLNRFAEPHLVAEQHAALNQCVTRPETLVPAKTHFAKQRFVE